MQPGEATKIVVEQSFVLDGDVADFNATAFAVSLAALIDGVTASDITLEVTAASVSVAASIAVDDDADATDVADDLTRLSDPDAASSLLGLPYTCVIRSERAAL